MRHGLLGAGFFAVACACSCLGSLDYLGVGGAGNGGAGASGVGGNDAGASSTGGDAACEEVTSSDNCGACGHSCFGGGCVDGRCQPVVVASDQDHPFGIGVDGDHVYWSNRGSRQIMRAPRKGGDAQQIAASTSGAVEFVPGHLVVQPAVVAWTNEEAGQNGGYALLAWSKAAMGDPSSFAGSSPDGNGGLAAAGDTFYFGNWGLKAIRTAQLGQENVETIATEQEAPGRIAVDETHVYWTLEVTAPGGGVLRMARQPGATPESLSRGVGEAWGIALDDEFVYVTSVTQVLRIPKVGGPALELANGQIGPTGIAVDDARVFWTSTGAQDAAAGAVLSVAKDGGEDPVVIASGQASPFMIAVDDEQIYWTNNGGDVAGAGAVMRVAR